MGIIRIFVAVIFMFREASLQEIELVHHLQELGNIHVTYGGVVVSYMNLNYNPINVIDGQYGSPDECDCCAALIRPARINIDLVEPRSFKRIYIVGRTDFPKHFGDLQITITTGSDDKASFPISSVNNTFIVNASPSLQYVRSINVSAANSFTIDNVMTVCDVKIFQNINLTSQSSTWSTCVSDNAINGQRFEIELSICHKCSATEDLYQTPWWELDLGFINLIGNISVEGRTDTFNQDSAQSKNLLIYISNGTVGPSRTAEAVNNASNNTKISINQHPARLARYIYITHSDEYPVLTLCDVVVYPGDCPLNTFGDRCSRLCHCKHRCNAVTGYCNACSSGWRSFSCEEKCYEGIFGENCSNTCSGKCQNNVTCDHVTGDCTNGCKPGYDYTKDSKCNTTCSGQYGVNCAHACSQNCLHNETCNNVNGECQNGCVDGYDYANDKKCTLPCFRRYGVNCAHACSQNCLHNVTCNNVNGECQSGCVDGYDYAYDKKCTLPCLYSYGRNCKNACSTNCLNNDTCNSTNGECPNGCAVGYNYTMDRTCKTLNTRAPSTQLASVTVQQETHAEGISMTHPPFETMAAWSTTYTLSIDQRETNNGSTASLFAAIGALSMACGLLLVTNVITICIYFRRKKRATSSATPVYSDTGDAYDTLSSAERATDNYEGLQMTQIELSDDNKNTYINDVNSNDDLHSDH